MTRHCCSDCPWDGSSSRFCAILLEETLEKNNSNGLSLRISLASDRRSLRAIAEAGGGQYFELGTERDEVIALKILSDIQQRAQVFQQEDVFTELYWLFLAAAAGLLCMGTLVLKDRTQLWWQLATGLTIVILLL